MNDISWITTFNSNGSQAKHFLYQKQHFATFNQQLNVALLTLHTREKKTQLYLKTQSVPRSKHIPSRL